MNDDTLLSALAALSGWEALAVVLSVTYLVLAVRQNPWCWAAALVSTAIFSVLFWRVQLPMQAALNVYYLGMAVYGWWQWTRGGATDAGLPVTRWSGVRQGLAMLLVLTATVVAGRVLELHSAAARPYLDAFITFGAVVTTFMVARKVLDNWAWWMVINSLAVFLFLDRGLPLTAALHLAYLVISVFGWRRWRADYRDQSTGQR
ncbi:MAG: nicotinamide riboside transporter PnuC [Wenzhouxiangellaceae bacterium]|nr:nicotinamide riboside transporter PnuC [Wenzhouxiangellaceae bacterium]